MEWSRKQWERLSKAVLQPRIDDAELIERLRTTDAQRSVPTLWLLGKAQAGKTSIIRTLTGREDAEIGHGFRPCTRHSRVYDFPDAATPLIRFLDTRGLGEIDYRPDEDLAHFSRSSQILMPVMNAMDPDQNAVLDALATARKAGADGPVIVVQTTLHHGYPDADFEHIQPYPYADDPWPAHIPTELTRALMAQRRLIPDARHVAVDFTLPEDDYPPIDYGVDALWAALEDTLPHGYRSLLAEIGDLDDLYARRAEPAIIAHALTAGSIDLVPVPGVALPLVVSIQARLCHALAQLYGQPLDKRTWTEIGAALGTGFLARLGGRQLIKLVPVYGPLLAALTTGATTYALGKVLCYYFGSLRCGARPDPEAIRRLYAAEFARGRERLREHLARRKKPGHR